MKKIICIIALSGLVGGALVTGCKKAETPATPPVAPAATNAMSETPPTNATQEVPSANAVQEAPPATEAAAATTNAFPNGWPGMQNEHRTPAH